MHTSWANSAPRALGSAAPPPIPKCPHAPRAQSYNCTRQLPVGSKELCSRCGACSLLPVADLALGSSRKLVESFSCYSNGLRKQDRGSPAALVHQIQENRHQDALRDMGLETLPVLPGLCLEQLMGLEIPPYLK